MIVPGDGTIAADRSACGDPLARTTGTRTSTHAYT